MDQYTRIILVGIISSLVILLGRLIANIVKWNKSKNIHDDIKGKLIKKFTGIEVSRPLYKPGLEIKFKNDRAKGSLNTEINFTSNGMYILPEKFTFLKVTPLLPIEFNKRLYEYSYKEEGGHFLINFIYDDETKAKLTLKFSGDNNRLSDFKNYFIEWQN